MRKKFLIKPSLQIKHLVITLSVVFMSCVVGYFLFESMFSVAFRQLGVSPVDLHRIQFTTRLGFVVVLTILMAAIGVETYLLFHQFIGPLYALEKGLKKISEGDFSTTTHIRESDQLGDLVNAFENMRIEINQRLSSYEKLNALLSQNISATEIHHLSEHLKQIRKSPEK